MDEDSMNVVVFDGREREHFRRDGMYPRMPSSYSDEGSRLPVKQQTEWAREPDGASNNDGEPESEDREALPGTNGVDSMRYNKKGRKNKSWRKKQNCGNVQVGLAVDWNSRPREQVRNAKCMDDRALVSHSMPIRYSDANTVDIGVRQRSGPKNTKVKARYSAQTYPRVRSPGGAKPKRERDSSPETGEVTSSDTASTDRPNGAETRDSHAVVEPLPNRLAKEVSVHDGSVEGSWAHRKEPKTDIASFRGRNGKSYVVKRAEDDKLRPKAVPATRKPEDTAGVDQDEADATRAEVDDKPLEIVNFCVDEKSLKKILDKTTPGDSEAPKNDSEERNKNNIVTSMDILASIEAMDREADLCQEKLQDITLEMTRLEATQLKQKRALDKVQSNEPLPPQINESDGSASEDEITDGTSSDASNASSQEERSSKRPIGAKLIIRGRTSKSKTIAFMLKSQEQAVAAVEDRPPSQSRLFKRLGTLLDRSDDIVQQVLQQSREMAIASRSRFSHLVPDILLTNEIVASNDVESSQMATPKAEGSVETLEKARTAAMNVSAPLSGVQGVLRQEFRALLSSQVLAAIHYRVRFEQWSKERRQHLCPSELCDRRATGDEVLKSQPLSPSFGRTSSRRSEFVRSDLEERQAIATLQLMEQMKHMVTVPAMRAFSPRAARWTTMYHDKNRLVEDPGGSMTIFAATRPWEEKEVTIFLEKFMMFHKDFVRIASFLPGRTVPEVVRLYYAVQKTEDFDVARRKWQLRKRRERAEEQALMHRKLSITRTTGTVQAKTISQDRYNASSSFFSYRRQETQAVVFETSGEKTLDPKMAVDIVSASVFSPTASAGLKSNRMDIGSPGRDATSSKDHFNPRKKRRSRHKRIPAVAVPNIERAAMLRPVLPEPPVPPCRGKRTGTCRAKGVELVANVLESILSDNHCGDHTSTAYVRKTSSTTSALMLGPLTKAKASFDSSEPEKIDHHAIDRVDDDQGEFLDLDIDECGSDPDDEDVAPEMEAKLRAAAARAKYAASNYGHSASNAQGRGRLPKAATDAKFQEAARRYGRDFNAVAAYVGGGRNAAKVVEFWRRHAERLELEALADACEAEIETRKAVANCARNLLSIWKPVLMDIRSKSSLSDIAAEAASMDANEALQTAGVATAVGRGVSSSDGNENDVGALDASPGVSDTDGAVADDHNLPNQPMLLLPSLSYEDICFTLEALQGEGSLAKVVEDDHDLIPLVECLREPENLSLLVNRAGIVESFVLSLQNIESVHSSCMDVPIVVSNEKSGDVHKGRRRGPRKLKWTSAEKDALLTSYSLHGLDYPKLKEAVPTKSLDQIRNLYNNYKRELFDVIELPSGAVHPPTRKRKSPKEMESKEGDVSDFDDIEETLQNADIEGHKGAKGISSESIQREVAPEIAIDHILIKQEKYRDGAEDGQMLLNPNIHCASSVREHDVVMQGDDELCVSIKPDCVDAFDSHNNKLTKPVDRREESRDVDDKSDVRKLLENILAVIDGEGTCTT